MTISIKSSPYWILATSRSWIFCIALFISGCFGQSDHRPTSYVYRPWTSHWGYARFGTFDLRMFFGNKTEFDNPQGLALIRPSKSFLPVLIGVNSGKNNLLVFTPQVTGRLINIQAFLPESIYPADSETILFNNPLGIAASDSGSFYVIDHGNARIVKLRIRENSTDLMIPAVEAMIGSLGSGPGQFLDPRGVAVVGHQRIAVIDNVLNRVTILNDEGGVETFWEGLIEPVAIASSIAPWQTDWTGNEQDFLVVADSLDRRITIFDLNGNLLNHIDAMTWNAPLTPKLSYIAIDRHRQILVTDRNNGSIHKLDRHLNYLGSFGETGVGCFEFDEPRGIAVDWELGNVYVLERERLQTLAVAVDVTRFTATMVGDSHPGDLSIDFWLTEAAYSDFDLLDRYDRFIARLVENRLFSAGENHFAWGMKIPLTMPDGKPLPILPSPCVAGEYLPDGAYKIKGNFRATYGSRNFFVKEVEVKFDVRR